MGGGGRGVLLQWSVNPWLQLWSLVKTFAVRWAASSPDRVEWTPERGATLLEIHAALLVLLAEHAGKGQGDDRSTNQNKARQKRSLPSPG